MLTNEDLERERLESRRKGELDFNTRMKEAQIEGYEKGYMEGFEKGYLEGFEIGLKIELINIFEQLLNRPLAPFEEMKNRSLEDLSQIAEELQSQLLSRWRLEFDCAELCEPIFVSPI